MREGNSSDYIVITITLLLAMILTLVPLPAWAVWLRPNWVLAITIFWLLASPERVGIGLAWCVGLFMDLLTGTLLGEQALLFCITAYFVLRFQHWLIHVSIVQQTVVVFLLILFDLIVDRCMLVVLQRAAVDWFFWLPAITTALVWPLISGLLYLCRVRLRLNNAQ